MTAPALPAARRVARAGAAVALAGTLVSGPPGLVLVNVLAPQPAWEGAATFARHFHPLQLLPFFAGFLLVGGFVILVAALHELAEPRARARTGAAVAFAAAFAALVFLNYTVQTTLVPSLIRPYQAGNDALIAVFSMANPSSLAWAIEMWAYGILGVATWLVAPALPGSRPGRLARRLFVMNGIVSVISAVLTALRPGWVLEPAGLPSFVIWNVLVVAMLVLTLVALRRPEHDGGA